VKAKAIGSVLDKALNALTGRVVLVEGKNDKTALTCLGVSADIRLAHGIPLRFVERHQSAFKEKGVVLLFDFDAEGRRKNAVFTDLLLAYSAPPLSAVRTRIRRVFGVRTIEDLPSRYEELLSTSTNR
jgi:5S rRNA maturation endonuclease (ribonuclease M5)